MKLFLALFFATIGALMAFAGVWNLTAGNDIVSALISFGWAAACFFIVYLLLFLRGLEIESRKSEIEVGKMQDRLEAAKLAHEETQK